MGYGLDSERSTTVGGAAGRAAGGGRGGGHAGWAEGTWVGATAKQIARAVRRGDTSATQVLADHLEYIDRQNELVGALRTLRPEAVAEAEAVDEQEDLANLPLAGVPVAVKEDTAVAGLPTWRGSAAAAGPVAEADHEVVRRLRGAGAVVVGTSRMPELGLWAATDDPDGTARNPWRTDRTPGGSSGGAAAAVAAGLVPLAHGTDALGSVRIPAACCGLVGIKPGRGVVPRNPEDWYGLNEHGILATTVADAVVGLAVLAGWRTPRLAVPDRLRVAVSTRSPIVGVRADRPAREAVSSAARLLQEAGHETFVASPRYPTRVGLRTLATWCSAAADLSARAAAGAEARTGAPALQRRTRRHAALGRLAQRRGLVRAADRERFRAECAHWFAGSAGSGGSGAPGYDVLITPALAGTPPAAAPWHRRSWTANVLASVRYAPFLAAWNVAGFPAAVVPVGVRPDGLPMAVQLVGPPGSELLLLAVAGQLEAASPWLRHAPGYPRPSIPSQR